VLEHAERYRAAALETVIFELFRGRCQGYSTYEAQVDGLLAASVWGTLVRIIDAASRLSLAKMLNRNITRCLGACVALFALCANSYADCIRVSPGGRGLTNVCDYKVMVEWTDQGSCKTRCSATIDGDASHQTSQIQPPWRKYECKYDDWVKRVCRLPGR
jgi:hypothetical protein